MTNSLFKSKVLLMVITLALFQNCAKENLSPEEESSELKTETLSITPVVERLIEMGYDTKNILELDEYYVVEGDLLFPKKLELIQNKKNEYFDINSARHFFAPSLVHDNNLPILVHCTFAANDIFWTSAVNGAINDWNAFSNAYNLFAYTTDASAAKITIGTINPWPSEASSFHGWTLGRPVCGEPAERININLTPNNQAPETIKARNAIAHELGHAIGFNHTDDPVGLEVPGLPSPDDTSIMHLQFLNPNYRDFNGLSPDDITATNYLYGATMNQGINNTYSNTEGVIINNVVRTPNECHQIDISGEFGTCQIPNGAEIRICISDSESPGIIGGNVTTDCIDIGFNYHDFDYTIDLENFITNYSAGTDYYVTASIIENGNIVVSSEPVNFNFAFPNCNTNCSDTEFSILFDNSFEGYYLSWNNTNNESYSFELEVNYECFNGVPFPPLDGEMYFPSTNDDRIYFNDIVYNAPGRAWKFRYKKAGCPWSEYCCLSLQQEGGDYTSDCVIN